MIEPAINPHASALGKMNAGKPRRPTSPEGAERRRVSLILARQAKSHKRAQAKDVQP